MNRHDWGKMKVKVERMSRSEFARFMENYYRNAYNDCAEDFTKALRQEYGFGTTRIARLYKHFEKVDIE